MPNNVGKIAPNDWRRQHFLDWLCTPPANREPPTMKALAEKLTLSYETLNRWRRDTDFLEDWEQQYRKVVGSPEKAQAIVERLWETADDRTDPRHVQAAKAYLEAIDAIRPKQIDVTVTRGHAKDLSDEQLYTILAERAAQELADRSDA